MDRGNASDTRGSAFVVYENIFDAKSAVDHLNGFNVKDRCVFISCIVLDWRSLFWTWLYGAVVIRLFYLFVFFSCFRICIDIWLSCIFNPKNGRIVWTAKQSERKSTNSRKSSACPNSTDFVDLSRFFSLYFLFFSFFPIPRRSLALSLPLCHFPMFSLFTFVDMFISAPSKERERDGEISLSRLSNRFFLFSERLEGFSFLELSYYALVFGRISFESLFS